MIKSVKGRILIIFFGCVILPAVLFTAWFVHSYASYILKHTISEKQNVLYEIRNNIDLRFRQYQDTSMSIYYNSSIRSCLDGESIDEDSDSIVPFLSGIVNSDTYITAAVMELNGVIYESGRHHLGIEKIIDEKEAEILSRKGRVVWFPTQTYDCSYGLQAGEFILARAVNSPERSIGVLLFFISENLFQVCLDNPAFMEPGTSFCIMSDDMRVIAGEQPGSEVENIIVSEKTAVSGWTLMAITKKEGAFRQLKTLQGLGYLIAIMYIVFIAIAYAVLSSGVFKPVRRLDCGMKQVAEGQFRKIEDNKIGQDEIGRAIFRYNEMVDQIQNLIADVRMEEKKKNEATFKALSMQINPHFVYNSLNTIKWMAAANRQDNISRMVESLMKIMSSVTYHSGEETTLQNELDLVGCYVYIQKMRFTNFEVEYNIPENLKQSVVLRFILQPFVENSIKHAFRDLQREGYIKITAGTIMENEKEKLELKIIDNGCGFDSLLCDYISSENSKENQNLKKTAESGDNHAGIRNVQERILLLYGKEYGVSLFSRIGTGTEVTLLLPLKM